MEEVDSRKSFSPALEEVLRRLLYEPDFRKQFRDERSAILDQYGDLTDKERQMLLAISQQKATAVQNLPVPDPARTNKRTEKAMITALVALVAVGALLAGTVITSTTVSTLGIRPTTLMVSHTTCGENLTTLQRILEEGMWLGDKFPDLYLLMQRKIIGPEIRCPQGGDYKIVPLTGDSADERRPGIRCSVHGLFNEEHPPKPGQKRNSDSNSE